MDSYGMIYQNLIHEGARSVMIGHIAQPAMARAINPDISKEEAFLPASQSETCLLYTSCRDADGNIR